MHLMFTFFRARPKQTAVVITALLLAGLAEGVGFSAVLPFLSAATGNAMTPSGETGTESNSNQFANQVSEFIRSMGIEPTIGAFLLIVIFGAVIKNLLLLQGKRIAGYSAAQVATDMRMEMLRAVLRSKWEFFLHRPVGAFSNSMATEAFRASQTFMRGITFITWMIQAFVYLLVALVVSWQATLVCLGIGFVIVLISHSLVRVSRRAGRKQTKLLAILISRLNDTLSSVKPLKAMAREHLVSNTLARTTEKLNRSLRKQVLSSAMLDTTQDSLVAIVAAGGMYVALVQFDMPFATVVVLVIALERVLSQMGKVQKQYQKVVVGESAFWSMKKSIEEAQAAEEHLGGGLPPSIDHSLRFEDVVFSYEEKEVLRSVNLDIAIGKMTTITGSSGAGKTTLIDVLIALLRPQSGCVRLDGQPLEDLDIKAWRGMIGYVPQETFLLHDSILNNVTLGDPELSHEDAIEALKAAGIHDFVMSMPEGIDTIVGERGLKISGGQRQRIVIARALVNRPRLLILDEATSALDPTTEAEICATMVGLRGKLTILAISHQAALVQAADFVYLMKDGRAFPQDEGA